jgi:hypothetical protein
MTDTTIVAVPPSNSPTVLDWAAIFAGAAIATALSLVLFAFGTAGGVASVSPYSYNNPSATTVSIVGTAFVLLVMIGSFIAGGYFAGRFRRTTGTAISLDERSARDGAHGLAVWAVAMLIGVAIAGSIASGVVRTAASVTGQAASMAAPAAGNAARSAASSISHDQVSAVLDGLMRADPRAPAGAANNEDQRSAVSRILASSFLRGTVTEDDKTYLIQVVAARAGVNEDEARKRVDAAIAQVKQAAETAKAAADKARKAAAILAFLIGAASIISAGGAYWAATAGGEHRDGL